jgi:hypothetical protein
VLIEWFMWAFPALWLAEKLVWIAASLFGLIGAAGAAFEAGLDLEAVNYLGEDRSLVWTDTQARRLKAIGNQRTEFVKVAIHAGFLLSGVVVAVIEPPVTEQGQAIAVIMSAAVICASGLLIYDTFHTLRDRRLLWRIFRSQEQDNRRQRTAAATPDSPERP